MQEEYEKLLAEMENFKNQREHGEDFYQTYQEMYGKGAGDEKHESPTKRLVNLKDTTVEHKAVMDKKGARYGESYKLTYCANPTKSYVVEPGKEINYKLAETNPEKFYQKVFDQEITKHKVAEDKKKKEKNEQKAMKKSMKKGTDVAAKKAPLTMTSKVTKRPFNKIMEKVRMKIREKLHLRLAGLEGGKQDLGDVIMGAFDDTRVNKKLNVMLKQKKIKLVDEKTGQPRYEE